jgi:uncharacterized glyoxalase superfamily protein PhnB
MKKGVQLVLEDEDLIELMRILMDEDAEAALAFLKKHFKGKARDLLGGVESADRDSRCGGPAGER